MKVIVAQLNPVIGDIPGNLEKVRNTLSQCCKEAPDLVVFPELFLVGYPPRDLLERPWFIERSQLGVEKVLPLSKEYPGIGIILGAPLPSGKCSGRGLYNSALLICDGKVLQSQHKSLLPTYDVFDEERYFDPAPEIQPVSFKGEKLGISICEDAWNGPELWPRAKVYTLDPMEILARKGATLFINISASPFSVGKERIRYRLLQGHSKKYGNPLIFVNQVGGNDELIFDGRSMCFDRKGEPTAIFPSFREQVQTIDTGQAGAESLYCPQEEMESVYEALVLGIKDYLRKCGFSKAVVALSGGIDSAVTSCLARDALGSENVLGVTMPSEYSSKGSVEDSKKLAQQLKIECKVIPISETFHSCLKMLEAHFEGRGRDITEENIQARIRGNVLMALSNKFGYLVLSTGNKSELAVGYCTLYGDMSGGLCVLSDVPKTMVYKLAGYLNRNEEIIPRSIVEKEPSAELKPGQKDQDTLPPYEILDPILHYYVDEGYSLNEIVKLNFNPETVKWVIQAVKKSEYKRRQAPPGLKVTTKAFGMGRRMAVAAKYDD